VTEHYVLMRLVRRGPLMPVRFWLCDHAPGEPWNKRDRWPLAVFAAEVARDWYDPPPRSNDPFERGLTVDPVLDLWARQFAMARWKRPTPITSRQYRYESDRIAWCREHRPHDPRCHPWRAVRARDVETPEFAE
jgi:hypothetical protein